MTWHADLVAEAGPADGVVDAVGGGGDLLGEAVDVPGVSAVVEEVLDGALAGGERLPVEPVHGEHGEAAVLDLLDLELGEGVRVVGEAEGVEGTTGVDGVEALAGGAAVDAVGLGAAHEDDLARGDGQDGLGVDEGGVAEVVEAAVGEDQGALLEPGVGRQRAWM